MRMRSMRVAAVVSMLLLAACGSSGNAALNRSFTYGTPQAPSSSEQSAASSAQSTLSDTTSFSGSADANKGLQIVAFADAFAAAVLGDAAVPGARPPDSDINRAVRTATTD